MKPTSKDKVIAILLENGWIADGKTVEETFRMGTRETPVYGGVGGKLVTTGGRLRYKKFDWKVTVGQRTTYFWNTDGCGSAHIKTSDVELVREYAQK